MWRPDGPRKCFCLLLNSRGTSKPSSILLGSLVRMAVGRVARVPALLKGRTSLCAEPEGPGRDWSSPVRGLHPAPRAASRAQPS